MKFPWRPEWNGEKLTIDLTTLMQMWRYWFRLLKNAPLSTDHKAPYLSKYPLNDPATDREKELLYNDKEAWQLFLAAKERVVNILDLLVAIESGQHAIWVDATFATSDKVLILKAEGAFKKWIKRLYSQPEDVDDNIWAPSHLEYRFECSAPEKGDKQALLKAEQYHHGHLDWYSFDIEPDGKLNDKVGQVIPEVTQKKGSMSFIPTPIEFGGMPNVRWWEMEDRKTDFGDIDSETTDVAKLLLTEFALIYGNDWSLVPYDLETGTLTQVKGIVVTDVFGIRTFIKAAGTGLDEDWQRWNMYNLNKIGDTGLADNPLVFTPSCWGSYWKASH